MYENIITIGVTQKTRPKILNIQTNCEPKLTLYSNMTKDVMYIIDSLKELDKVRKPRKINNNVNKLKYQEELNVLD